MSEAEHRSRLVFADEHGNPLEFYIHGSVKEQLRDKVAKAIEKHGGEVVVTDEAVDTTVVPRGYPYAYALQVSYNVHPNPKCRRTRVEDTRFIFQCIKSRRFKHTPVMRSGMRGSRPGRTTFTEEDELNICRYLALRLPDPAMGGRLGHKVYEDLIELSQVKPNVYHWALRHPAESWREHYRSKKNKDRLDALIGRFARKEKPTAEQLYPYDRRLSRPWPPIPLSSDDSDPQYDSEAIDDEREQDPTHEQRQEPAPDDYNKHGNGRNLQGGVRTRQQVRKAREALKQEEEESGDERNVTEPEESDDGGHRPSSLFSVEDRESGNNGDMENHTAPDASQATLVDQAVADKSPRHSSGARSRRRIKHSDYDNDERREEQPRSPDATAVAHRADSPQRPVTPIVLNPVQRSPKRTRSKGSSPSLVREQGVDAPYRNTRARSRSVDPFLATNTAALRQTKRRKGNSVIKSLPMATPEKLAKLELEAIEEEKEAVPLSLNSPKGQKRGVVIKPTSGHHQQPVSVPETIHDEADVERLLTIGTNGSSAAAISHLQHSHAQSSPASSKSAQPGDDDGPSGNSNRHLRDAIDTDDEQIDRKLSASSAALLAKSEYDTQNPLDLLKEFNQSTAAGTYSVASTTSSSARAVRPLLLPRLNQEGFHDTDASPSTPSEESFPLQGTRASAAKRVHEERLKREEYIPPFNTRAAQLR